MKVLNTDQFIFERIKVQPINNAELNAVHSKFKKYKYFPKTKDELRKLVEERMKTDGLACDLNDIYTGNITDMSYLFANLFDFNGDISEWDVSNVTNMEGMFMVEYKFAGDISQWDTSKVKNMSRMFKSTDKFNCLLDSWDVSNVEDMSSMFAKSSYSQDLQS